MIGDTIIDIFRRHLSNTNVCSSLRRNRPRKAPAVAVEHRQRPQVNRMCRHIPFQRIAKRIQISPAIMVNDALRVPRRTRGIVDTDRIPLVRWAFICKFRIATRDELFVILRA